MCSKKCCLIILVIAVGIGVYLKLKPIPEREILLENGKISVLGSLSGVYETFDEKILLDAERFISNN